jgi:hypothetical protein
MLSFLHRPQRRAAYRRLALRAGVSTGVLLSIGLVPAVAVPGASAATSALTATSPPNFGPVLLGVGGEKNVTVTNTGASSIEINVVKSVNSTGSLEFLPGSAFPFTTSSCLNQNGSAAPIPAHGKCTLGIYFVPTKFGPRSTTMNIVDSAGGTLRLNVAGTGVAGYFMAGTEGQFRTFGFSETPIGGSPLALRRPVVGMAATPFGLWLVASDGGIFTFGDAHFFGSTGNVHLAKPIVGMAATPDGNGYWLVASDGGIFTFGDAHFFGSTGNVHLTEPIVGMAASPNGAGYWLVASDGGVFTFNVPFEGSLPSAGVKTNDVVGIAPTTGQLFPFQLAPADTASHLTRLAAGRNEATGDQMATYAAPPARRT